MAQAKARKADPTISRPRVQTLFRLDPDDLRRWEIQLMRDGLWIQVFCETIVLEYLKGNRSLLKVVKKIDSRAKKRNHQVRKYAELDDRERNALMNRFERESPLRDDNIEVDVDRVGLFNDD